MGKGTNRINASIDDEAMRKLEQIKRVLPKFNLSKVIRDAIMAYDPLDALNASMPDGFEVVRSKPVSPVRRRYRSDTVVEVVRSNSDYKDF